MQISAPPNSSSSRGFDSPLSVERGRGLGLVVQHRLDLLLDLGRQLVQQGQRLDVVVDLVDLCGAEDDGADVGVAGGPGEGELRGVAAELLGDLGELLDLLDLGLALVRLQALDRVLEELLVGREPRALGYAVVVLAGEQAAGEGAPDGGAVVELVEQRLELDLEALAVEGVVLGLLGDGGDQVVLLGEPGGLGDLLGAPLAGAPVVRQVEVADGLCEALDDLQEGCADIGAVGEDDVDVWGLQALQAGLETLDDVLSRQAAGVGLLAPGAEEDLGDQDVLVAGPVELLEGGAHLNLAGTVGVDLGGVECLLGERARVSCWARLRETKMLATHNAMVPSRLQDLLDNGALLGASVGEPATEGEDRDLETGGAQVPELHVLGVVGGADGWLSHGCG